MAWAEARIGPERIKGAYAWRSLRRSGARLVLSSDLPATDYNVFYGLHSAITRQDKSGQPPGGWRLSALVLSRDGRVEAVEDVVIGCRQVGAQDEPRPTAAE